MSETEQLVEIPESKNTVGVSIIDTTVRFQKWKIDSFVEAPKIAGHTHWSAPSWAFRIAHPEHGIYLFDLGVRKDWKDKLPTKSREIIEKNNWTFKIDKDVPQILIENGEKLEDVRGIIWSHWHWDHTGDPTLFPSSTKLIVGPCFKESILPGYPQNPNGAANSDAWQDRKLEEVEMTNLKIGGYAAVDYFGDGSFYLLDSPGHTVGHLCALARTTSKPDSSFIFMGGDVAHFIGQYRPTERLPLPDEIRPDPRIPDGSLDSFCPCAGYVAIHPKHSRDTPYYVGARGMAADPEVARASTQKLELFDSDDRVLTVIAHDNKLEGIIDVYPKDANGWKEKKWKQLSHWRFLGDFQPDGGA